MDNQKAPPDLNHRVCDGTEIELFEITRQLDLKLFDRFRVEMRMLAIRYAHMATRCKPLDQITINDLIDAPDWEPPK